MENRLPQPTSTKQSPHSLTINDLPLLLNILNPVATKCYAFGLMLEVHYSQLQNIEHNFSKCEDRLREIIAERLKQKQPLTWLDIVRALRTDTLREHRLASEIENRYLHPSCPAVLEADQSVPLVVNSVPSESHISSHTLSSVQGLAPAPASSGRRSVSMPTHTTPSLQSSIHVQSNGQGTATPVSAQPELACMSEVVEAAINRHTSDLTRSIGNDLTYFSNKFIELGFISRDACDNILTKSGIGNGEKGGQLLSLVIANSRISCDKKEWFDKYVSVFSSEAAYASLATSMTEVFTNNVFHCSSIPSTMQTALPLSVQPHPVHTHLHGVVSSQFASSTAIVTSPVNAFIDYVKTIYTESEIESDTSVVKWPPTPSKLYINLMCIDRHSRSVWSDYDEVTEAMVRHGNVDAIEGVTKRPIQFSEIAKNISTPNSRERAASLKSDKRRLILVEGAPGVGKSTFAWEFCRRWERGEIAQQYQLVLLLRLREEIISNAKSLEDLIYHPSKHVCQAVTTELEYNVGANTLIILEGFDELPDTCRKGGSVFMDLIAGKLLPLATVLVTSRPWATQGVRVKHGNRIYQHIEILGFTGHQITEYIESTLPQDKVSDLKVYLENHPQIRAGMYIPINSAIMVTVYQESLGSGYAMPATLTELYTSLSRTLLLRYLHGHPEYDTGSRTSQSFRFLPPPVNTKFLKLCKIAYDGTVGTSGQVQLIFRDLPSEFDDLGFMDSVTELYVTRGAVSSHNFLHLTFQEFFAAVHISTMSPAQQMEHFKRHKEGRMKVVLKFLAGLTKLNCFSNEESDFFELTSRHRGSRYLTSCDVAVGIDLVQWLFEAQSDDVIEQVLERKTIEFNLALSKMLPLDYYSLGYCISHSQCQWVLGLGGGISEDRVRMLGAGASTITKPRGRVVGLGRGFMLSKGISASFLNMLSTEWKSILRLHQLSLILPNDYISWPDLSALRMLELYVYYGQTKGTLHTLLPLLPLQSLAIRPPCSACVLLYEDCVALADYVTCTTILKELSISLYVLDKKGMEAITAALASNQLLPLERLELECRCTFTATAGDSLVQFTTHTATLQYLSITRCTFSAHALLSLARAIHHNSTLQTKILDDLKIIDDNEAKHFTQLLMEYPDLVSSIRINNVGDAGAVAIAQALHNNSTLTRLGLSNSSISHAGAVALAQALRQNSTLKDLNLSNNSISDAGAAALALALCQNSTLKDLDLYNNSISDTGAVALAQTLHHNSTLQQLTLSSNDGIGENGTCQLVQAMTVNASISDYRGLKLPKRCEKYATKCPQYPKVKNKIGFH